MAGRTAIMLIYRAQARGKADLYSVLVLRGGGASGETSICEDQRLKREPCKPLESSSKLAVTRDVADRPVGRLV